MGSGRNATGWNTLFLAVRDQLKDFAAKQWPLEPDGSGSDAHICLHRLFNTFPVPADVLLLDTTRLDLPHTEGRFATAIRYDFSRPNTRRIHFHGTVPLVEADAHAGLIESALGIGADPLRPLKELTLAYLWAAPQLTHVVPYDARTRASDYAQDLARHLSLPSELSEQFSPKVDYNLKYNLQPDPPATDEELLRIDELTAGFVKPADGKPETLSERHSSIAHIRLIPQVPKAVRRMFHLAKRLYVYGYLEYGFFTASAHYAHLALDAALQERWSAALPSSALLTWHNKKIGRLEKQNMASPGHMKIREFCKTAGWKVQGVAVDGKPFPYTVNRVIAELTDKHVITHWQRRLIKKADVEIGNSLAYQESAHLQGPSTHSLELAAKTINGLFDSEHSALSNQQSAKKTGRPQV